MKDPYAENARLRRYLGQALAALERQPTFPGGLRMGKTPWAQQAKKLLEEDPPERPAESTNGHQATLEV